jgi:hypothetical protein
MANVNRAWRKVRTDSGRGYHMPKPLWQMSMVQQPSISGSIDMHHAPLQDVRIAG